MHEQAHQGAGGGGKVKSTKGNVSNNMFIKI
jgi:hypothetical protein